MLIAIHQPNYMPWQGYFHKIAKADHFVFLDDVQFPKQGYVNRTQILEGGHSSWLTVPARPSLGTSINKVRAGQNGWPERHLSRLRNVYRKSSAFKEVWTVIENAYGALDLDAGIATSNRQLIIEFSARLGLQCKFTVASACPNPTGLTGGDRLVDLVARIGGTAYLSGRGGAKYQNPAAFTAAGLDLVYTEFEPQPYHQASEGFTPGLSIVDAVFNLGFEAAADLLQMEG